MATEEAGLYASPRSVADLESCDFYHLMEIPGVGLTEGASWDLRGQESTYLGGVDLRGKRVLEIGPASGFLTFAMEAAGAEVVCVELAPEQAWDLVPHPETNPRWRAERSAHLERIRNGFWFAHERFGSRARVHYGSAYAMPAALGHFDVAVMASVLLHLRDPLRVFARCAELADVLIVTDLHYDDLSDSRPLASLMAGRSADTWWRYTPALITAFAEALGLNESVVTFHWQRTIQEGEPVPAEMFTVLSTRGPRIASPASSNDDLGPSPARYVDQLELAQQALTRQLRLHEDHRQEVEAHVARLSGALRLHEDHRAEVEAYVARLHRVIAAKDAHIEELAALVRGEQPPDERR